MAKMTDSISLVTTHKTYSLCCVHFRDGNGDSHSQCAKLHTSSGLSNSSAFKQKNEETFVIKMPKQLNHLLFVEAFVVGWHFRQSNTPYFHIYMSAYECMEFLLGC